MHTFAKPKPAAQTEGGPAAVLGRSRWGQHRSLDARSPSVPAPVPHVGPMLVQGGHGVIQRQLTISTPEDPYEREADRIAEQIMTMPAPRISPMADRDRLQREEDKSDMGSGPDTAIAIAPEAALPEAVALSGPMPDNEANETETAIGAAATAGRVQRKARGAPAVTSLDAATLNHGGSPLEAATQAKLGHQLGADLSPVRVHTDQQAHTLSNTLGARAFTYQNHIYFAAGQYQPNSRDGQRLLAHELTHTIQQGAVQQTGGGISAGSAGIQRRIDTSILGESYEPSRFRGAVSSGRSGTPATVVSAMEENAIAHWGARNPVINMDVVDRWYYYVPLFRTIVGTTRSESTARFGRANLRWYVADDEYKFRFRYRHTNTRGPIPGTFTVTSGQSRTDSTTITGGVKLSYSIVEVSASASATASQTQSSGITVQTTNYYEHDYDATLDYDLKWYNPSDFRATRGFSGPDIRNVGGPHRARGSVSVGSVTVRDDDSNPDNLTP